MTEDTVKLGAAIGLVIEAMDAGGAAIPMSSEWTVAARVTRDRVGGPVVADVTLSIVDGQAVGAIDTGAEGWRPGVYYWDACLREPDGYLTWTEPVRLTVQNRNTPAPTPIESP